MIKILHTIDTTGPGGAETVFTSIIAGLDRLTFAPVVVIRGEGWICDRLRENGMDPVFMNNKGSFSFSYLQELVRLILSERIQVIQAHLLGSSLYCCLAASICRIPVISTFHGFVDIQDQHLLKPKTFLINCLSSRLVFVSENLKSFSTKENFSEKKSVVIHNGVDTTRFYPSKNDNIRKSLGLSSDRVLVGSVGNLRSAKGYQHLLQAAQLVIKKCPEFHFVVAGEGSGRIRAELLALREELGLESHFDFVGYEPDVPSFLNGLDFFVLPSISEGFSISTVEAMACGIPVVATRSGGPEEIVSHLENGVLVEPCSPDGICDMLINLYHNVSLAKSLVKEALDKVQRVYSADTMLNRYANLYQTVCKECSNHTH